MTDVNLINRMSSALASRFETDGDASADSVEAYLDGQMAGFDRQRRIETLQALIDRSQDTCRPLMTDETDEDVLTRVCSLLLGRKVSMDDLSSSELLEKLAESLNTIFNTLNQLISVINMTFTGEGSPEQTIRQVIGFRLEGEGEGSSLETYLGQISNAFLTSQQSFKEAAYAKVKQVLGVLDPEKMAAEVGRGLKFGPMKKAEMYEIYVQRYEKIQKWFSSGRFMEDFLREFEKNCQTKFGK
ncbi:hypothetical protein DSCA_11370 [Desulfosarcina alkanivorans]|jgi:hypothetical protein|uniref:Uncharacterized protein n=1 Tax=Desulfosarcina alkanivorans TaxID=571177 RepID=A0A5K7YRD9_9BACT|nr:hypothetical protein [Desulfosarcina alkanivorans]BBO67207.1 hypothetical protein DSCA_11370 [Desulfosarcina alkanivorans]